ncbi:MAG: GNAT family N-acetyltransferase [Armatimonadota bacterium]
MTSLLYTFPLVDRQLSLRLGCDLSTVHPGTVEVVETPIRLQREISYHYRRACWWVWLADGRSVVSVLPGAGKAVRRLLGGIEDAEALLDPALGERFRVPTNDALSAVGLPAVKDIFGDLCFACNRALLRRHSCGESKRLVDESIPPAEGLKLPTHCFPYGIVYAVIADGHAVSTAYAHRTGVMEDLVADIGIVTAPAYRRKGYAKTAVSALVDHITRQGGEARYSCAPDNHASIATAQSIGFVPYATSLLLMAPAE